MQEITSDTFNIGQVLSKQKYGIDYYQRQYVWENTHVTTLVNDLSDNFLKSFSQGDARRDVRNYGNHNCQ